MKKMRALLITIFSVLGINGNLYASKDVDYDGSIAEATNVKDQLNTFLEKKLKESGFYDLSRKDRDILTLITDINTAINNPKRDKKNQNLLKLIEKGKKKIEILNMERAASVK